MTNSSRASESYIDRLRDELLSSAARQMKASPRGGSHTRIVWGGSTLLALMLGTMVVVALLTGRGSGVQGSSTPLDVRFGIAGDHPLADGRLLSDGYGADVAATCKCPSIGSLDSQVAQTYVDSNGGVGYVLTDGTWIVMTRDGRSMDQYIADMEPVTESGDLSSYDVVEVGDRDVIATDATPNGPAGILWVENGYRIEVLAVGGATLDELETITQQIS